MTDERDDENLKKVKRWFAQPPDEGGGEAVNGPAPLHPKLDLRAIAAVATGWLSEAASSRHEPGMIANELYGLAIDENSSSGLRLFDEKGVLLGIHDVSFEEFSLQESSDTTVELAEGLRLLLDDLRLSLDDLRRLCETSDGQTWCESWGLPSRPVFLFGEPTLEENSDIFSGGPEDETEGSLEALQGYGPHRVPEGYIIIPDAVDRLRRRLFDGFDLEGTNPNSDVIAELNNLPDVGDGRRKWMQSYCEDKMLAGLTNGPLVALEQISGRDVRVAMTEASWRLGGSVDIIRTGMSAEHYGQTVFLERGPFETWFEEVATTFVADTVATDDDAGPSRPGRPSIQRARAKEAINALYPNGGAEKVKMASLVVDVNKHLDAYPVGRNTVKRALEEIEEPSIT